MGNQDDSGSSLPRYGWSGTNQQFATGSSTPRTPTKDLYKTAGTVVAGATAIILLSSPNSSPEATPWTGFGSADAAERKAAGIGGYGGTGGGNGDTKPPPPDNTKINSTKVNQIELDADLKAEEINQLLFEDIGGKEIISLVRNQQINGVSQGYTPIKNLADLSLQYNPLLISANPNNITDLLSTYAFDIAKYIPTQEELDELYPAEDGTVSETILAKRKVVYFDKDLNSLFVHVKNIYFQENIEVEFFVPDEVKDGTIY